MERNITIMEIKMARRAQVNAFQMTYKLAAKLRDHGYPQPTHNLITRNRPEVFFTHNDAEHMDLPLRSCSKLSEQSNLSPLVGWGRRAP